MNKLIFAFLFANLALSIDIKAAEEQNQSDLEIKRLASHEITPEELNSYRITPYDGPTKQRCFNGPKVTDSATYIAEKTYLQLIEEAVPETLSTNKDRDFFMTVVRAFTSRGSGDLYEFAPDIYDRFYRLIPTVKTYQFSETTPLNPVIDKESLKYSPAELRSYDLHYALTAIQQEAYTAKQHDPYC